MIESSGTLRALVYAVDDETLLLLARYGQSDIGYFPTGINLHEDDSDLLEFEERLEVVEPPSSGLWIMSLGWVEDVDEEGEMSLCYDSPQWARPTFADLQGFGVL